MTKAQERDQAKVLKLAVIGCQDMRKLARAVMSQAALQEMADCHNTTEIRRLAFALPMLTEAQVLSATKRAYPHRIPAQVLIKALHQYGQKHLNYPKSKAAKK